jgi:D-serine deaminase-like pyridoxal phosphate-dependent protein
LLVELDSGNRRTGVGDPAFAVRVAEAGRAAGIDVAGVFTHGGHSYAGPEAAQAAARDEVDSLTAATGALRAAGHEVTVCSAGSTPTALRSARGAVTEIRPGTYVYNDRLQLALGSCADDQIALTVASTVVSHSGGRFVLDAGAKTLTKDVPAILDGYGLLPLYPQARIARLYDHHAVVEPGDGPIPALGEVVTVVPNHVCPVVDLADEVLVVRAGEQLGMWPVDGRGRSR